MSATALSGKPYLDFLHPTILGNHINGYQGRLRYHAHLFHCLLCNGLPCPSRKQFPSSTD